MTNDYEHKTYGEAMVFLPEGPYTLSELQAIVRQLEMLNACNAEQLKLLSLGVPNDFSN